MKIKRPLLWAGIIITIAVIGYCSLYGIATMMAPRMWKENTMKKLRKQLGINGMFVNTHKTVVT